MSKPTQVGGLLPLPESLNAVYTIPRDGGVSAENPFSDYYSPDQMHAYAQANVQALEARLVALRDALEEVVDAWDSGCVDHSTLNIVRKTLENDK